MAPPKWEFEADYFTMCNCAWGCPCNFNARPTEGHCHGAGIYRIKKGFFGKARLDGAKFAGCYWFPGLVENGNGKGRAYIDAKASPAQRQALEAISSGKAGGGIFEMFHKLCSKWYPTIITDIDFQMGADGKGTVRVGDLLWMESDLLSYPDGTVIRPSFDLPHGIEFKKGLATNTKRWWIRDEDMLASHENVYGLVTTVKFTEAGCVG